MHTKLHLHTLHLKCYIKILMLITQALNQVTSQAIAKDQQLQNDLDMQ